MAGRMLAKLMSISLINEWIILQGGGYVNGFFVNFSLTPDHPGNALTREYKKEFLTEGQTFFYYKRLNLDLKAASGYPLTPPSGAYTFPLPDLEKEYRGN